ncbi:hypothetical protein RDWZM_000532 [Blomia tropicalis]|uniref:MAM domain-containing protein n=1 Tax=Blomia tropicalis TaxID=40697 RepID=A0A9Q0MCZ3_BLOTA|nr:hypothetical protein RDWZM_000532 [Blomia tropicalis]
MKDYSLFMLAILPMIVILYPSKIIGFQSNLIKLKPHQQWNCHFEGNTCNIMNQAKMPTNFQLISKTLFGETGSYYLDVSNCRKSGARLITPYFRWNDRTTSACLLIKYIHYGNGVTIVNIIKQDRSNQILWSKSLPNSGFWHHMLINVPLIRAQPVRFFIETIIVSNNMNRMGFFAISKITLSDSNCDR